MSEAERILASITRAIKDVPPAPRALILRFDVPMGRLFKVWDTRGGFVVYAHRGLLLSEAVHHGRAAVATGPGLLWLGVPVFYEP